MAARLVVAGALLILLAGSAAAPLYAQSDEQIAEARARGVRYLKEKQKGDGSWEFSSHEVGITALCTIALIENGVPLNDSSVQKGYEYVKKNDLITIDSMTDETGHQLPNIIYPGLDRGELVEWVERFYGEYFFRPRVVWRIVKKAIFNGDERRRLTKEAREYMALRSKRKRFVAEHKAASKPVPVAAGSGD